MEYDVLLRLVRQRQPCPVDMLTGRIVTVDPEYGPVPSTIGSPQMVQDIVIETPSRVRIVVMLMDPRKKSFKAPITRGDDHPRMLFEQAHVGSWISLKSVHDADPKKASLKTVPAHLKPAQHWAKKGVMVMVKATPSVTITPLLDPGQTFPPIRYPSAFHKKKKELRVPGSPTTDTSTHDNQAPRTNDGDPTMDMQTTQQRLAFAYVATLSSLQGSYRRAAAKKLLDMPPDEEFMTAVTTCFMELKGKTNVSEATDDEIRKRSKRITDVFVLQQIRVMDEVKKEVERDKTFTPPPSQRLPKIAQTCFIELSKAFKVSEPPQKRS